LALTKISEKQIDTLVAELRSVAYNLWWSWNPAAQEIFHELSPFFWEDQNHNAVEVINWISGQELRGRLQSPEFFHRVDKVVKTFRTYMAGKNTWGSRHARSLKDHPVAYFSAEFGLHESLRVYSGGLGMLAGDHAKSASDLGIPFVGITLFYRQGYFQQQITGDGWQMERYPSQNPAKLPIKLMQDGKGDPVVCSVEIGGDQVKIQGWEVPVGRASVYLLDTDLPENDQKFRDLTAHVYGGDQWTRISQEIVLGIGGVRFLRALGITPGVFHMNEGHSAFLTLELLREGLQKGTSLEQAEAAVKSHCVFTTHTPVPAGHDRFDAGLVGAALPTFAGSLGMDVERLMRYGRVHPVDTGEPFTMTVLALRMSRNANGVSALHGQTSREMWKEMYPGTPVDKVPIDHVTNGVHISGWASPVATQFWTRRLGPAWIDRVNDPAFWKSAVRTSALPDADLWILRTRLRRELVEFARKRMRIQQARLNADDITLFDTVLSPDALTIGFARRFATYKRGPMFFRDMEWALRILTNRNRPVQIIYAGKAHPRDDAGKRFIQEIVNISKRVDLFGKVLFLENYDINVARYLVSGADVWLNTPRRPNEACGTSGMKAIIHGSLHLSTMDGWWREAYDGTNGWKIGEDLTASNEHEQDNIDGASLRAILENEVIPLFYDRGKDGIPHRWLKRVRQAIASLVPVYNTHRMVTEYATRYYLTDSKHSP
jgi:starch phosphorylase